MKSFGAFEAKTHFSEMLSDVMHGEKYIITKHGTNVAIIIPFNLDESTNPTQSAIRAIKKLRKGIRLGKGLSIKEMRERGRK